jgi:cellobiose-specific phosphotransferase system component IIC
MLPSSVESKRSSAGSDARPAAAAAELALPAGDGFVARLERAVAPYARRFAEGAAVSALRESLPVAFGVVVLYLIALRWTVPFVDWPGYFAAVRDGIGPGFALASVVMTIVLSLRLAVRLHYAVAPMIFFALAVFSIALPREAYAAGWNAFAVTLGASGLFTAILVCLATAGAVGYGRRRFGPLWGDLAGGVALCAFAGLLNLAHFSIAGSIAAAIAPLATLGDSFVALALIAAIEAMLWLVGIHGPAMLAALVFPVYLHLQLQNTAAQAHHDPIPHVVVVSTFLFVFPGGAGATLPLVALLLRSRVPRLRTFAYATILPSLINVNEPVIFGLPLAYNPVLAVPFVLAPVVLSCTTYAAMALNLVGRPLFYVPSTLPAFVNVFLATLDWRDCVLVAVNLAIAAAIWLPFVRVYERAEAARA